MPFPEKLNIALFSRDLYQKIQVMPMRPISEDTHIFKHHRSQKIVSSKVNFRVPVLQNRLPKVLLQM